MGRKGVDYLHPLVFGEPLPLAEHPRNNEGDQDEADHFYEDAGAVVGFGHGSI